MTVPMSVIIYCPVCNSPRIVDLRHDGDWGGENAVYRVNSDDCYIEGDLSEDDNPDIEYSKCLSCGHVWG